MSYKILIALFLCILFASIVWYIPRIMTDYIAYGSLGYLMNGFIINVSNKFF